jgi:hypothetical protein
MKPAQICERGAVSRPSQVRLEPDLPQVFQDSIKQLQQGNNEFQDKNDHIHFAHTLLLWVKEHDRLTYLSAACCQPYCWRNTVCSLGIKALTAPPVSARTSIAP